MKKKEFENFTVKEFRQFFEGNETGRSMLSHMCENNMITLENARKVSQRLNDDFDAACEWFNKKYPENFKSYIENRLNSYGIMICKEKE